MQLYTLEEKLQIVSQSRNPESGGVLSVSKKLGVSYGSIIKWRREEAELRRQAGHGNDSVLVVKGRPGRHLPREEEQEIATWYSRQPGCVTLGMVLDEVRKKPNQASFMVPETPANAPKKWKNAQKWLNSFLKRYKLSCKGPFAVARGLITADKTIVPSANSRYALKKNLDS